MLVDKSLVEFYKANLAKQLKFFKRAEEKLVRAEKRNLNVKLKKFVQVKQKLFPNNFLQERHNNLVSLYTLLGEDVLDIVYNNSSSYSYENELQKFKVLEVLF